MIPRYGVCDFPLSVVSWQLFPIRDREPCGAHHPISGLMAALVLWASLTHFPALRRDDLEIVSPNLGMTVHDNAILNIECDFAMSLKELWRQTLLLKGEKSF